jgi:hypothetical protein
MKTVIQGLWIGQTLSTLERLSIKSYLEHGHEYHLYVYNDVAGAPPQTVLKDANEILPSSLITRCDERQSYGGFADYFRYQLLHEKGGYWSDLDIVCLKPLNFDADVVLSSEITEYRAEVVTNGFIKAPKGAQFLKAALAICGSKNLRKLKWGEIGPRLVRELAPKFSLNKSVKSAATFCPIPSHLFYEAILPGYWNEFDEQTYTVHLWNEMWSRLGIYKDEIHAPSCLYERLKRRYLT